MQIGRDIEALDLDPWSPETIKHPQRVLNKKENEDS